MIETSYSFDTLTYLDKEEDVEIDWREFKTLIGQAQKLLKVSRRKQTHHGYLKQLKDYEQHCVKSEIDGLRKVSLVQISLQHMSRHQ